MTAPPPVGGGGVRAVNLGERNGRFVAGDVPADDHPTGETGHGAAWAYSGTATAVNVVSGVCGLVKRALTR